MFGRERGDLLWSTVLESFVRDFIRPKPKTLNKGHRGRVRFRVLIKKWVQGLGFRDVLASRLSAPPLPSAHDHVAQPESRWRLGFRALGV